MTWVLLDHTLCPLEDLLLYETLITRGGGVSAIGGDSPSFVHMGWVPLAMESLSSTASLISIGLPGRREHQRHPSWW